MFNMAISAIDAKLPNTIRRRLVVRATMCLLHHIWTFDIAISVWLIAPTIWESISLIHYFWIVFLNEPFFVTPAAVAFEFATEA